MSDINLILNSDPETIVNITLDSAPVQAVNGKIGFVTLSPQDIGITGLATSGDLLNYATLTGLATTGSTLSTNLATTGSTLQTNLDTVASNLATTGSTLSTNLATTGSTLQTNLDTVASNLATTGYSDN